MTAATLTLTDFLLARMAEDEAVARDSLDRGFGGWEWLADLGVNFEARTHIVHHHPARVLAECAAKRAIVERAAGSVAHAGQDIERQWSLRALASVYADHDDFDPRWAL